MSGNGYRTAVADMERENTVERMQQGVARHIETGTTKTGMWFDREEKAVEDF